MSETIQLNGRIVAGHPMNFLPVKDKKGQTLPARADGTVPHECFFMLAIPKTGEADWKLTPWGQVFQRVAVTAYTNGETQRPDFSWKVIDGDSTIPNRNNKKPCDQDGQPGNWVVTLKTRLEPAKCFHNGKYDPMQQIQEKGEINCGDYGRAFVEVAPNGTSSAPAETPGIYVNPKGFSLDRKGAVIQTESSFDAASAFGGSPAPAAAPAQVAPPPAAPAPVSAPPAPAFLSGPPAPPPAAPAPEPSYNVGGNVYTKAQLLAAGYTEANLATLPTA